MHLVNRSEIERLAWNPNCPPNQPNLLPAGVESLLFDDDDPHDEVNLDEMYLDLGVGD